MTEQAHVDHRHAGAKLDPHKDHQHHRSGEQRHCHQPRRKPPFERGFRAVDQQQYRHNQHDCMGNIQRLFRASLLTRHQTRGKGNNDDHDRHVDQKDRSPVKMLQQHTANQRTKRRTA